MTYLMDKRRAVLVALVTVLLGGAALFLGAGSASANSFPCSETEGQDIWVNAAGTYAGVDPGTSPTSGWYWFCVAPTGGEANQKWVVVRAHDPANPAPGAVVEAGGCGTTGIGDDPHPFACTYVLEPTGAEVNPATTANLPGDGNSISAASVGTGDGTCTYVNSTTGNCPTGFTLLGVTVNEADLNPTVDPDDPEPPCTGIDNTCVPLGGTVRLFQDTDNPTLSVTTGVTGQPTTFDADPDGTCVQVNATC